MKISYDATTDTLSLSFSDAAISSRDLGDGISVEYDAEDNLARVVIHQVTASAAGKDVFRQIVIEGIMPFAKNDPLIIVPRLFEGTQISD